MPTTIRVLMGPLRQGQLLETYRYWDGESDPPSDRERLLEELSRKMSDAATVAQRFSTLAADECTLLSRFLHRPGYRFGMSELMKVAGCTSSGSEGGEYLAEAKVATLLRRGFLCELEKERWGGSDERFLVVPRELGDALVEYLKRYERTPYQALTLRGYLEHLAEQRQSGSASSVRTRQTYKLLAVPEALVKRVNMLAEPFRSFVVRILTGFGGLLPRSAFERLQLDVDRYDARAWRDELEKHSLGTVAELALSRYGIHLAEEVVVLFNETTLAYLEGMAEEGNDDPAKENSIGVDLISNVSRFLASVQAKSVRFTVKGEIFKTTERKILETLIATGTAELGQRELLHFIYHFCLAKRLIERTGERVFALTEAGHKWENLKLQEKLRAILDHVVLEKNLPGEYFHQVRMRRILLRFLKRMVPMRWYRAMFLPFVVRNHYLASLEELKVDEFFASRFQYTHYTPMEGVQEMCWNLFTWMRRRLHPLGLIDLGYDDAGRPVAFRLSRMGASFLGLIPAGEFEHNRAHLVVNPDYEVVLFPTGDEFELIHSLDRFCVREKSDQLYHFRLSEESVRRAVTEGMHYEELCEILRKHSRVPIPQNVLFSVREWSTRAAMLQLGNDGTLCADDPAVLDRFMSDETIAIHIEERIGPLSVRLRPGLDEEVLRKAAQAAGFSMRPQS